jgi:hypothetical protein
MSTTTDTTAEFESAMQQLLRGWKPFQNKFQQPESNIALFEKAFSLASSPRDLFRLRDYATNIANTGYRYVQKARELRYPIPIDWDFLGDNYMFNYPLEQGNPNLGYTLGPNGEIVWNEPS